VALFVFLIIMLSLSGTFTQSFAGYKNTRAVQKDVENAQFALNLMAKELRTSTVVSASGPHPSVKFYDHSKSICFEYKIEDDGNGNNKKKLTVSKRVIDEGDYLNIPGDPSSFNPVSACSGSLGNSTDLVKTDTANGSVIGTFMVTPSDKTPGSKKLGKITTSLQISEGPKHTANVQTTSALRDYGYIGLIKTAP
jgi:hypothetical protein